MEAPLKLRRQQQKNMLAPHKPLLILLAIGAWQQRLELDWVYVKKHLGGLLRRFTNSTKEKAFEPFMRLTRDEGGKLWIVDGADLFRADGNVNVTTLSKQNPKARFHEDFVARFLKDKGSLKALVQWLLQDFPDSLHQDILVQAGVEVELTVAPLTPVSKKFRADVMNAYDHQCAVCGFGGRIDTETAIGVEAAHIQMKSRFGPDKVTNGLALCSLHHKLFDSGAFYIDHNFAVKVSDKFGGSGKDQALIRFHDQQISLPRNDAKRPDLNYLNWQKRELFKE